jgi:HPt (histidine-containing phosphotransfer) domain-containing protein
MSLNSIKTLFFLNKNQEDRQELVYQLSLKDIRVETFQNIYDLINQLSISTCDLFLIDTTNNAEEEIFFYSSLKELIKFKDVVNCANFDDLRQIYTEIIQIFDYNKRTEFELVDKRLKILENETSQSLVDMLIKLFIERKKYYKKAFYLDLSQNNFKKMEFEAHNLKSSSANLGALNISKLCEYIELESSENNLIKTKIYLNEIFSQYDLLEKYLFLYTQKNSYFIRSQKNEL